MKNKTNVRKLVICAVMIALHIVLEFVSIRIGNSYKLTFSGLPFIITAIFFGPLTGFATGLVGTFLSQLLTFGITVTTPLWILPGAMYALSAGLIHKLFKRSMKLIPLGICVFGSGLVNTIFNYIATYFDSRIFNYYSKEFMLVIIPVRLAEWAAVAVICTAVVFVIVKAIQKKFPELTASDRVSDNTGSDAK